MAGKVTTVTPLASSSNNLERIAISFTADDTDGSFTAATISGKAGWITNVYIKPGDTAPTTAFDIVLTMDGIDLLGGQGANIDTSANASIAPADTIGDKIYAGFAGDIVMTPTGSTENSATFTAYVLIAR